MSDINEKKENNQEEEKSGFLGFVLLSDPEWDKEQLIKDMKTDWGVDIADRNQEEQDEKYKDILVSEQGDMRLAFTFIDMPVPNQEAEHYASANYMWKEAVPTVKAHKAQIMIAIMGKNTDPMERAKLFTKAVSSCLKQKKATAVYTDGAVFQPEFYIDFSEMLKKGGLPILNWVWFGLVRSQNQGKDQAGVYTFGMRKFGKDEIEVYSNNTNLNELRDFLINISIYVLGNNVTLHDGETIGMKENQVLPISRSEGIALDGMTLKIVYK